LNCMNWQKRLQQFWNLLCGSERLMSQCLHLVTAATKGQELMKILAKGTSAVSIVGQIL
jgi:hypothetical protein